MSKTIQVTPTWIYDKQGNVKYISTPVNANLKPNKSHKKVYGGLHSSVGFSARKAA